MSEPGDGSSARDAGRTRTAAGWLAAAGLVLAVVGWWPAVTRHLLAPGDPAERLAALRAAASPLIDRPWTLTADPAAAGADGRLVWSTARQEGYMVFEGLAPNDPSREAYQLWIFDAGRDRYPVDGGVFDMPSGQARVVIPVRAKLPVERPTRFAVTVEPPGGVVVSDRERVVATATAAE